MSLSAEQRDALTEVINIGASKGGKQLSVLLDDTIEMHVPVVDLVSYDELARMLGLSADEDLVCIQQEVSGSVAGKILLLYHSDESRQLVQTLIKPLQPFGADIDVRRFEHEAMAEIGNIVISGCAAAMSDFLGSAVRLKLPRYSEGSLDTVMAPMKESKGATKALIMQASLRAVERAVGGTLMITLSIDDMNELLGRLDEIIAGLPKS